MSVCESPRRIFCKKLKSRMIFVKIILKKFSIFFKIFSKFILQKSSLISVFTKFSQRRLTDGHKFHLILKWFDTPRRISLFESVFQIGQDAICFGEIFLSERSTQVSTSCSCLILSICVSETVSRVWRELIAIFAMIIPFSRFLDFETFIICNRWNCEFSNARI